jgi:hypothetical protein
LTVGGWQLAVRVSLYVYRFTINDSEMNFTFSPKKKWCIE